MAARLVSFSPLKPSLGQWFGQADAASLDPLPCPLSPPLLCADYKNKQQ